MKFKLSKEFTEKYPDAVEYLVIAKGLNNEISGKWIVDEIQKVSEQIRSEGAQLLKHPEYQKWIDVYEEIAKSVNLKAKDFLPSHVALTQRILSGKDLPNINPAVNYYNLFSLKYGLPFGGEDLAQVYGDQELGFSKGDDKFVEIGSSQVDDVNKGEVVWKDAHSVTCRMWAWRQTDRTKLTKSTRDIYFIIDGFTDIEVDYEKAVNEFAEGLKDKFNADVEVYSLSKINPEQDIGYESKSMDGVDVLKDLEEMASQYKKSQKKAAQKHFMKRKAKSLNLSDPTLLSEILTKKINEILEKNDLHASVDLDVPRDTSFGDYSSTIALRLAKELKRNPKEIAENIVKQLKSAEEISKTFEEITIAPNGFINFKLSKDFILPQLADAIKSGDKFGSSKAGKDRMTLIEGPSINPNAAAHVGHLLNIFIARSLGRLLEKAGFKAEFDNLINDRGIKICQAMWGILNFSKKQTPEAENMKPDQFVGKYYNLGKKAYREDPKAKEEISQMLRDWEAGKPEVIDFWKKMIKWAFEGHKKTIERIGEEVGHLWLESELYKPAMSIIDEHLGKGTIEKLPDGAYIGRLEDDYGVPDVILVRSDGTALYHTQDVYLTLQKIKKFNPWQAVWVIGNEQIAHFHKLFALLDKLGILPIDNCYHYAYGMIVDKSGKKVGKETKAATADEFLDMMKEMAKKVIEERKVDIKLDDIEDVAEKVALGALRYSFLARDPFKDMVFDPEESLSFTGRSGPYVMYAYTRGRNVLRNAVKGDIDDYKADGDLFWEPYSYELTEIDRELILKLLQYPQVVLNAANTYSPNVLAEYLYEVASLFNNFYEKETVSNAEGSEKELRIAITKLVTVVLKDGLGVLGIKVLEKM